MQIIERTIGDVTILDLQGKLAIDDGAEILHDKVASIVFQGQNNVAAESGRRALHGQRWSWRAGAVFDSFDSEELALGSFGNVATTAPSA